MMKKKEPKKPNISYCLTTQMKISSIYTKNILDNIGTQ